MSATLSEAESQNAKERAPQTVKNTQTGISTISAMQVDVMAGRVISCDQSAVISSLEIRDSD